MGIEECQEMKAGELLRASMFHIPSDDFGFGRMWMQKTLVAECESCRYVAACTVGRGINAHNTRHLGKGKAGNGIAKTIEQSEQSRGVSVLSA
jgi:hypothetical protein